MRVLQLTVARLDVFDADAKEFQILSLVVEVLFQAFQQWRQEAFG